VPTVWGRRLVLAVTVILAAGAALFASCHS
jgi:hypothetical protein